MSDTFSDINNEKKQIKKEKMLLTSLLLALSPSSFGEGITLSSVDDFTIFVSNVSSGIDYSGDTVYLGSDLSLSGKSFEPIGNETYHFSGTFDGQGHIISNLKMNVSYSEYTGLFGYSTGLTIKNVILDGSCSITNSYRGSERVYVGGIIGRCYTSSGECNIESSVNMADVTFNGNVDRNLYLGGIVGEISSSSICKAHVKNCVNYGSITDSGTVSDYYAELGGVVGASKSSTYNSYVQNCLNYGTITHSGTSAKLCTGGIVGYGQNASIENCVGAGKIVKNQESNYVGSVVGWIQSGAFINYCYFTNDVNVSRVNGAGTPESTTGTPTSPIDVDTELVSKLNRNATSCNWNKWFMLHLTGGNTNNLAQEPLIGIQGQIPNPVKEGNSFLFWCKDAGCTEEFDPESVSGITDLYAGWSVNNYTVTFDFGNGTTVNVTFTYNKEITYPEMNKEGYTFSQWDNYHELMPAGDITVTAQWIPNNYTVIFDPNGGSVLGTSIIVTFDKKYGNLTEPSRAGYIFFGWFTNNNKSVTSETIVTTSYNHTLYAHWEEVTNYVEIVFSKKDLTKEDVEKLIEQYAKTNYEITKFKIESGDIKVIIKFGDKEAAENFIENIKGSSEMENIKKICFCQDDSASFSAMTYPLSFLSAFFL